MSTQQTYTIRQGATRPTLLITPSRDDGTIVNVSGAQGVRFIVRDVNLAQPVLIAALDVIQTAPAVFRYSPSQGDTDIAGDFLGEVEVTYDDGTNESFPTTGFIAVTIVPSLAFGEVPQPGGKSGNDWLSDTRTYLEGGQRDVLNVLSEDILSTDMQFTLQHNTPLSLGDRLCIGMETMHVWSYNPTNRQVTVQRGVDGTQALNAANGTLARINPRFTHARIWSALKESLPMLQSSGLYAVRTLERVYDPVIRGLDLANDLIGEKVLAVNYLPNDSLKVWREVMEWAVVRNVDTDIYPSGNMLSLPRDYIMPGLWPVKIVYAATLGALRSPADEVLIQTGLPATALDLPPLYAAIRLMGSQPIQRADTRAQPTGRRPDEVSTSDVLNSANGLRATFQARLSQEVTRLAQQYPTRLSRPRLLGYGRLT